jgi:hypothetical protein
VSRLAYIWVMVAVAAAFLFHGFEEAARDRAIKSATSEALYFGIKAGCRENNKMRDQIWDTAAALHPGAAADVRANLDHQNCERDAQKVVDRLARKGP